MNKIWLAVPTVIILCACSTPGSRPDAVLGQINQAMAEAASGKPRVSPDEAMGKAVMPPIQLDGPAAPVAEPRFNLAVNNAPASQVFMALVAGTKYSMVFAPDLSGTITLNLKNVTVREALDTIRDLYGYEYKIQGNRITIQSNTMQTRIFQINYLASRRQGLSDVRVSSSTLTSATPTGTPGSAGTGAAPTQAPTTGAPSGGAVRVADSSRVTTISENDFWKGLETALEAIVSNEGGRRIILNPLSGVILVKGMPSELRAVEDYLKATQLVVERQVMLEAKVIDVQLSSAFQTGINWAKFSGNDQRWALGVMSANSTRLGATGTISGAAGGIDQTGTVVSSTPGKRGALATTATALGKGFFGIAFQSADFASLLSFLESQGNVQVLSSPRIATINNQKAVLKVGTDQYFITNVSTTTTTSTTGNTVSPVITTQSFFSGISLDVTPQIDDDGNIILHVHPVVTQVEEVEKRVNLGDLGIFTLPLASSTINETDSIVRVQDGNIVAIGGLMRQRQARNRNGLPGASQVPGVGMLFGQTGDEAEKRELVILIKPTVIQNAASWRQDLVDTQDRLQAYSASAKEQ